MPLPPDPILAHLLDAYRQGVFPMADPSTGRIDWFSPDPRALMPLAPEPDDTEPPATPARHRPPTFHISRSLRRRLRARPFLLTTDLAFEAVVRACAEPRPDQPDSWIDDRIVAWYTALHHAGHAHSIEAWIPSPPSAHAPTPLTLVGGIYGVSIGAAFFAESKFCRPHLGGTDASKIALVTLVQHLRARGFSLMDVQFPNPHIDRFGVYTVRRRAYLAMLKDAVAKPVDWLPFAPHDPP